MISDEDCLTLGLTFLPLKAPNYNSHLRRVKDNRSHESEQPLSLTLSLEVSGETSQSNNTSLTTSTAVKRERPETDEEEDRGPTVSTSRKKLRLSKKQSVFLEATFNHHTTLNPKQKQVLADQLSLRPRQIEVWFQNRRARTKLKQTEADCEQMKKYCDTLRDENQRLQKELQELKAFKLGQPGLYTHLATTRCPSCSGSGATVPVPTTLGPKTHFYPSFPNPSAAC